MNKKKVARLMRKHHIVPKYYKKNMHTQKAV